MMALAGGGVERPALVSLMRSAYTGAFEADA
jgi:hypothetical protein